MKNTLISVVVALYNGEKYLKEQIKSLVAQTYPHLEIIIVDDGSSDSSLQIARSLVKSDGRIKVYESFSNRGMFGNFLKGLSYANGEYICFCDQDDYWHQDKIAILKQLIEKDKECMLGYSDLEICDADLKVNYSSFWQTAGYAPQKGYLGEKVLLKNISPGCAMMFRKQVKDVLLNAPQNAPFMHDHFALITACGLGKIAYTKEKLVKYRQHTDNNIGAFYDSVINKERIIRQLKQDIEYLRNPALSVLSLDLEKMKRFCKVLADGNIFARLSFIDYYLFLRRNRPRDQFLSILDCLSPKLYSWLKVKLPSFNWIKRFIFMAWIIVVLFFFAKDLIMFKFIHFLSNR